MTIDNVSSDLVVETSGVPQGTVLGPILYYLHETCKGTTRATKYKILSGYYLQDCILEVVENCRY